MAQQIQAHLQRLGLRWVSLADSVKAFGLWVVLASVVGIFGGLSSAAFLALLDRATVTRLTHPELLWGLPVAGAAIGWLYHRYGQDVARGNNLLIDEVHAEAEAQKPVPFRLAPMILITTVVTHLFGGSAGREGTAVQMGGGLADSVARVLKVIPPARRLLLIAGIAAGFGAVFGTPWAGAAFGIEVLAIGQLQWVGLLPSLVAAFVGDAVCRATGIHHPTYAAATSIAWSVPLGVWLVIAGAAFAGTSGAFVFGLDALAKLGRTWKGAPYLRPVFGGFLVIAMTLWVGNQSYNGLGIPLIQDSFSPAKLLLAGFAIKLIFTVVTLGFGFKGGEVTPLFCIGALLGHTIAQLTGQDPSLFAALGFVAVFSAAANTPIACTLMGIELFGSALAVPLALVCFIAYAISGHRGIYHAQRVVRPKPGRSLPDVRH